MTQIYEIISVTEKWWSTVIDRYFYRNKKNAEETFNWLREYNTNTYNIDTTNKDTTFDKDRHFYYNVDDFSYELMLNTIYLFD